MVGVAVGVGVGVGVGVAVVVGMTEEKKNVHILVPKGFQGRELLKAEKGLSHDATDTPSHGQCMKCRGTGGVFENFAIVNPTVDDGRIVNCEKTMMSWSKCPCYMGQRWRRFHPANVQAILLPVWEKEIREAIEREKSRIIRESGGNYDPHQDTFLRDTGLRKERKDNRILSLDEILAESFKKKGDFVQ